jgi:hypothetical protein
MKGKALKEFNKMLTKEDIDAPRYLDWTDEKLAGFCRATSAYLAEKDIDGWQGVQFMAASMILIDGCVSTNADSITQELCNVTFGDGKEGTNWRITIEKI